MTNPVPNYSVTTGYKKTGSSWTTCNFHTGQDYAAPSGTQIVAARAGIVAHVDYGPAFGGHQFAIRPGDGTEDFYAHCQSRPVHGAGVASGQAVAKVGSEGNSTGPHLHFERHSSYGWSCSKMADPMLSHNDGGAIQPAPETPTAAPSEEDDMFMIESPARGVVLLGPGYTHTLNPEERDVLLGAGVRLVKNNDRGVDVARAAMMQGDQDTD